MQNAQILAGIIFQLCFAALLASSAVKVWRAQGLQLGGFDLAGLMKDRRTLSLYFSMLISLVVVAWLISVSLIVLLKPVSLAGLDPAAQGQALTLIGSTVNACYTAGGTVFGYWLGTSASSGNMLPLVGKALDPENNSRQ